MACLIEADYPPRDGTVRDIRGPVLGVEGPPTASPGGPSLTQSALRTLRVSFSELAKMIRLANEARLKKSLPGLAHISLRSFSPGFLTVRGPQLPPAAAFVFPRIPF